jgi:chorismate mutase
MRLGPVGLVLVLFIAILPCGTSAGAGDATRLVAAVAQRLSLAPEVARAKWSTGHAVEDAAREREVLDRAVEDAAKLGLDENAVRPFFKDQIEANKLIQYHLLGQWRRAGNVDTGPIPDLANHVRPELDRLEHVLLAELAKLGALRANVDCPMRISRLIGDYAQAHQTETVERIALDRALGGFCAIAQ